MKYGYSAIFYLIILSVTIAQATNGGQDSTLPIRACIHLLADSTLGEASKDALQKFLIDKVKDKDKDKADAIKLLKDALFEQQNYSSVQHWPDNAELWFCIPMFPRKNGFNQNIRYNLTLIYPARSLIQNNEIDTTTVEYKQLVTRLGANFIFIYTKKGITPPQYNANYYTTKNKMETVVCTISNSNSNSSFTIPISSDNLKNRIIAKAETANLPQIRFVPITPRKTWWIFCADGRKYPAKLRNRYLYVYRRPFRYSVAARLRFYRILKSLNVTNYYQNIQIARELETDFSYYVGGQK